jgi:CRP-like cAMP-binding protein
MSKTHQDTEAPPPTDSNPQPKNPSDPKRATIVQTPNNALVHPNSQKKIPKNNTDELEMSVELGSSELGDEVSISGELESQFKPESKRSVNDQARVTQNSKGEEVQTRRKRSQKKRKSDRIEEGTPRSYARYKEEVLKTISKDNYLHFIIKVLQIHPRERTQLDIDILLKATVNLKFFLDMTRKKLDIEMQTHLKTCKVLAYEKFSRGDAVVEWDDLPTRFFAILDGRTGVYIPRKAQAAAEAALVEKINAWNTKRKSN